MVPDGRLLQIVDGIPQPVAIRNGRGGEGIPARHARIIKGLIPIRDAVRQILQAQAADRPWGLAQRRLRTAYAGFVRRFGSINRTSSSSRTDPATGETKATERRVNLAPFQDDPDCWLVASIEDYDLESDTARPGPIFTQRVIAPPAPPTCKGSRSPARASS